MSTIEQGRAPVRRLQPEARRAQIVREATRLISVSGFNAVSLADIADACGIRKPSVLHYFPTMNDLLMAVIAQRDIEADPGWVEAARDHTPEAVRGYLRRVVERNLEIREIIRLFSVLGVEAVDPAHPAHAYFESRNAVAISTLEGMFAFKAEPRVAAVQFFAFWRGIETVWSSAADLDFLEVWDSYCDLFFSAR
jgi:AcrR family transcriptional regulator